MAPRVAIIGGGISGISLMRALAERGISADLYEAEKTPGGLIRCQRESGHLYHLVGGHVFNSKRQAVKDWLFGQIPNCAEHLLQRNRQADILFPFGRIDYPIENHIYQLPRAIGEKALEEIRSAPCRTTTASNFGEFLRSNFGGALYDLYFKPYNEKVWGRRLEEIPMNWLRDKLPTPSREEILEANASKRPEAQMVHSTFVYPRDEGSQFWIERLRSPAGERFQHRVEKIERLDDGDWSIDDVPVRYTHVVYTGDVTRLADILFSPKVEVRLDPKLRQLKARGLSNVLCRVPRHESTWTYIPDSGVKCNRMINTGILSPSNSPEGEHSSVFEFPYGTCVSEMEKEIRSLCPKGEVIASNSVEKAYIIQEQGTRALIDSQKKELEKHKVFLLGRFAEWEYYNMDDCMRAALDLARRIDEAAETLDS